MAHYYKNIKGAFNFEEVYDDIISISNDGDIFVEIGSWLGRSTCYMAEQIKNSGKKIEFHCIDPYIGTPGDASWNPDGYYQEFLNNMKNAKVDDIVISHKIESEEASSLFENESLKFVYIDGNHEYGFVKKDLELFYPKLKSNGVLAGHDYQYKGVNVAVDEFFENEFETNQRTNLTFIKNTWVFGSLKYNSNYQDHFIIVKYLFRYFTNLFRYFTNKVNHFISCIYDNIGRLKK